MQSWLVTVNQTITDDEAFARLIDLGATPDADSDVIPYADSNERTITVHASASVADALSNMSWVTGVFPNSEMQLF